MTDIVYEQFHLGSGRTDGNMDCVGSDYWWCCFMPKKQVLKGVRTMTTARCSRFTGRTAAFMIFALTTCIQSPAIMAQTSGTETGAASSQSDPIRATRPTFSNDGPLTRFSLDLSRVAKIDAFGLADPFRIVVELPEVRFDVGAEPIKDPKGPVTSWRYGLFMAGRSRLVFDTAGPVEIVSASVVAAERGARLDLMLRPTDRSKFLSTTLRKPKTAPIAEIAGLLPKSDRQVTRPAVAKPVIVLDPGHGGIDVGTRSPATGTFEKNVVLDIARLLQRKLEQGGRYDVRLTRSDDTFIPLGDRVKLARSMQADLFLSIHADAEYDHSVRGATIYTLDDRASDAQAAALAAKENASDVIAGVVPQETADDVADILIDLTVRETKQFSQVLARNLVDDLRAVGKLVKSNPHRSANFRVLKAHDIPSALVELGFLSNKQDEVLMMSPEWRERTTGALVDAIDRFFQGRSAERNP